MATTPKRGFAAMDPAVHRALTIKGGKLAHAMGRAHVFTSDTAREAGRKGGIAVSKDRGHMARIGAKGGAAVSRDPKHMRELGRLGGAAMARKARAAGR